MLIDGEQLTLNRAMFIIFVYTHKNIFDVLDTCNNEQHSLCYTALIKLSHDEPFAAIIVVHFPPALSCSATLRSNCCHIYIYLLATLFEP